MNLTNLSVQEVIFVKHAMGSQDTRFPSAYNGTVSHLLSTYCVAQSLSRIQLFATPWTVAHQAPLSMGFPRQEYWSGLPCPPPGDLPDPGMESTSPMSTCIGRQALYN